MHIDERIASFGKIDATPRLEVVDAYLAERNAVGKRVFPDARDGVGCRHSPHTGATGKGIVANRAHSVRFAGISHPARNSHIAEIFVVVHIVGCALVGHRHRCAVAVALVVYAVNHKVVSQGYSAATASTKPSARRKLVIICMTKKRLNVDKS